jgi:hypothetical protein
VNLSYLWFQLHELMFYFCLSIIQPAGGQSNIMFSHEEPAGKTSKKLRIYPEVCGADRLWYIFADGKAESRDHFGGVRRPPCGESSISLV